MMKSDDRETAYPSGKTTTPGTPAYDETEVGHRWIKVLESLTVVLVFECEVVRGLIAHVNSVRSVERENMIQGNDKLFPPGS
jgi:hypothetical protein